MWIKMLDTYVSGNGSFFKDLKYDLPPDTIKLLPKGCYEKTCAPWEEHRDQVAIDLAAAKTKAGETKQWADILQEKADKEKAKAADLAKITETKQAEEQNALKLFHAATDKAEEATEAAKKADASKGVKNKAQKLTAEANQLAKSAKRVSVQTELVVAELQVAWAKHHLLYLDAGEAKENAEATAKDVEDMETKIAKAKADAKEKVNAKAEAEAKAKADAEAKAIADAKAKAEAKAKANAEKEAKARADAEAKIEAEAYAKAKTEADARAKVEAEAAAAAEKENTKETVKDGSEKEESQEPADESETEAKDDSNAK